MASRPKNGYDGEGGLSSSYPKASGAFLSSLFRSRSRDSDSNEDTARSRGDATPASSAPSVIPSSSNGSHATSSRQVKPIDKAESGSSNWLLHRKSSEKKKDKPERLKNALFGHAGHASKEVKGAVKVGDRPAEIR